MPETHVNMYGGSPLNRLSWLRTSQAFLNAIVTVPTTRWLLFNTGQPLVTSSEASSTKPSPVYLTTADVKPFLGPEPFFGQGKEPGDLIVEKDEEEDGHSRHSPTEASRHIGPRVVFLGLHEGQTDDSTSALPSSEFKNPKEAIKKLEGTPYLAMDISELDYTPDRVQEILKETAPGRQGQILSWFESRSLMSSLDGVTGAIFAEARSLTDWNIRNKFCPACGSPTYSMWGGWKIACVSLLPWADNSNRKTCPTIKGLHNFTHPRTDAVVIMIAIDESGDRILLGRGRKYPGKFYSALAGFIEPAESFEDAVAREMWEEAGVRVWNITYHSGQPWPFPANLMVGFYARADSTKPIRTDLDNELVDARWFTREEVLAVLHHTAGTRFGRADYRRMRELTEGFSNNDQKTPLEPAAVALTPSESLVGATPPQVPDVTSDEPPFRLPPLTAIAGVLIRDWAEGKISFPPEEEVIKKGNL